MTRVRYRQFLVSVAITAAVAAPLGQSSYEKQLDIRPSQIPHAGNGVFTKAAIPKGADLGAYTGEFIPDEEYQRRLAADKWQYMWGCWTARSRTPAASRPSMASRETPSRG